MPGRSPVPGADLASRTVRSVAVHVPLCRRPTAGCGRGRRVEVPRCESSRSGFRRPFPRRIPTRVTSHRVRPGVVSQFGGDEPGQVHAPFGVAGQGQVPDVFQVQQPLFPGRGVPDRHQSRVRRVIVAADPSSLCGSPVVSGCNVHAMPDACGVPWCGWLVSGTARMSSRSSAGEPGGDHVRQPTQGRRQRRGSGRGAPGPGTPRRPSRRRRRSAGPVRRPAAPEGFG